MATCPDARLSLTYSSLAGGGSVDSAYTESVGLNPTGPISPLPVAEFFLPGLSDLTFIAWGGNDGVVYVGYYHYDASVQQASSREHLRTVLALPLLPSGESSGGDTAVRHVVYGGTSKALLMAASDTHVAIFTLETLVFEMIDYLESPAVGILSNGFERVGDYWRLGSGRVVEGDERDERGKLEFEQHEKIAAVGWTGRGDGVLVSSASNPTGASNASCTQSRKNWLRMWSVGSSLECVWSTETNHIERNVQGGVSVYSPCVTATGGDMVASVWWVEIEGKRTSVRREELKHPTIVKSVEWSAGVLRKEARGDEGVPVERPSTTSQDHPAIMTVDVDGCVRIWVEMMVMISSDHCDCYFAMNLVIPPMHATGVASVKGSTSAMWVKPVDHAFQRHPHTKSAQQRILWLLVACRETKTLSLYALRGLAPVVVSAMLSPTTMASAKSGPFSPTSHSLYGQPKKPQLLLWGQYVWDGLCDTRESMRLSARMLYGDDFPIVDCVATGLDACGNFLLTSGVSLVTTLREDIEAMHTRLQPVPKQGIHLDKAWSGYGRLRRHGIVSTLVMRQFVILLDAGGCLDVWRLGSRAASVQQESSISTIASPSRSSSASGMSGQDLLTYYGSLPLADRFPDTDLADVSMMQVTDLPAGYDSVMLVADGGRRVVQVRIALAPDQQDIGVVGSWCLFGRGVIHITKDGREGGSSTSASMQAFCIRDDDGRVVCETYTGFNAPVEENADGFALEDGAETDVVLPAPLAPMSSTVLPVVLEDDEAIVHIQDADMQHEMIIGTSSGRIFIVRLDKLRGRGSMDTSTSEQAATPGPSSKASSVLVDTFAIDRFRTLDFDPVHGLLAAVRALDDKAVALYKIISGDGRWHVVPCGEIHCAAGASTAIWMIDEILPCLAVGDRYGRVAMHALDNTKVDSWSIVAAFQGGQEATSVDLSYANSCLVCSLGRSAGIVGLNVQDTSDGRIQRFGKALLGTAGPLPPYHPVFLRALVISGRLGAFFDILRALKEWLETIDADGVESFDSLECCSRESSDMMSPLAAQARARVMPHMFPGVSSTNFILHSEASVCKTLDRLRELLDPQGDDLTANGEQTEADAHAHARDKVTVFIPKPATVTNSNSYETGMLDLGAFGMGTPPPAPLSASMTNPAPAVPSFESGMLDMSSFGIGFSTVSPTQVFEDAKETVVAEAQAAPPPSVSQETGMLDMAAFGMSMPTEAAAAPPPHVSHETGMLDMAAFGMSMPTVSQPSMPQPTAASPSHPSVSTIALQASSTTSVHQCLEYLTLLDQLIARMQSPYSKSVSTSTSTSRYIPGLTGEDTQRFDESIRRTKDVLVEVKRDVDTPTLVYLVSLAWVGEHNVGSRHGVNGGDEDDSVIDRKVSFVNAAGVPMDYSRLNEERDAQLTVGTQSETSRGLDHALGLGPLLSAEAVVWMCLSSQDGSQALEIARKIQGDVCPAESSTENPSTGINSKNAFLAVPQPTGDRANTWESLRSTGVAFWQQEKTSLVSLLEESAKVKFRESRDPDTVALIYAAIGKIPVLRGLYKTCNRTKEAEFFSRDFSQENNKVAANKNAFVLLGQHRYAMAATFFILGGKLRDAVEVCLHQMGDLQLAIVLYRTLGEDMDIYAVLKEALSPYEHLSVARFLRYWVAGNLPGAVESLLTMRHPSEGAWIVQALIQLVSVTSLSGMISRDDRQKLQDRVDDPASMLSMASTLSADVLSRNGMPLLGLESELVAFVATRSLAPKPSKSKRKYGRWRNEASNACALAMLEVPVSLIPDLFAEEDFNQRIAELINRIEELQNLGIEVSTNAVLHRIERIYKSLSYCSQTAASPATPKSSIDGSGLSASGHLGSLGAFGLGRTHSLDSQSRHSNQTSGFSSLRRTSLDDAQEHQQLAKMISRSRMTDDADDASFQIVYPKGVEIFRVDGDVLHSVCSCPLLAPDVCGRLIAVATPKNGILEFATHLDVAMGGENGHDEQVSPGAGPFQETPRYESPRHDAGMFSKLVSQIFDQTSWMTDPLESQSVIVDGDVGLAARLPAQPSARVPRSPLLPSSPSSMLMADAKTTVSKMLVAHPYRQLFLSGCKDTARIKLWQYDGPRPLGLFTPVPHHDLEQLACMNHDMFSMSSNFAKSQSLASKMSHWGRAVDMCFSENGERFASIGQGGVVAVWSLNSSFTDKSGTDVDGATCSEWWHTCLEAQGRSVAFVGGSSAVVAAAGQCNTGNVSLWNTSLPDREACIGRLRNHKSAVNKVKTLPGGWLLAAADDAGMLSVSDVRMLGSDRDPILWTSKACKGVVRAMETIAYESRGFGRTVGASRRHHFLVSGNETAIVTGGDDGIVRLWDVNSGTLLQQSERVHAASSSTPRILSLAGVPGAKYGISGLAVCDEGIITSGTDGVVRLLCRL